MEQLIEELIGWHIRWTASNLTIAACAGLPPLTNGGQPKDNQELQARNLVVWEVFRIFCSGGVQVDQDKADWPDPKVQIQGIDSLIQTLISKAPALGGVLTPQVIQSVLGTPQAPAPAPAAPVAAPGAAPIGNPAAIAQTKRTK